MQRHEAIRLGINGGRLGPYWLGGSIFGRFAPGEKVGNEGRSDTCSAPIFAQHGVFGERMRLIKNQQLPGPA